MLKRIIPLAAISAAIACSDSAPPPPAFEVAAVATTTLPASVVGSTIAAAPTFEVRAENGRALRVPVTVAVTSGGGTIANAPTRSERGPTSIGTWTLGTTAGTQTVTVTVPELPPLVFTVQTTAAAASAMQKVGGTDLRGPANSVLALPVQVRVVDAFGNGVSGATVNWAVEAGGGNVSQPVSLTNAEGIATSPPWTLGAQGSGVQRLRATAGSFTQLFEAAVQNPPASITVEVAPPTSATVGSPLPTAPTFAVRDADGNILNTVPVTISVTAGGGSIVNPPATTLAGPTSVGSWVMGTAVGTQSLTISVAGIPSAVLTTQAVAGPPASIEVTQGGGQSVAPGEELRNPIRVRVRDTFQNPVPNAEVSWMVISGGGSIASTTSTAGTDGIAQAPLWTTGICGGPQTLRATSGNAIGSASASLIETYVLEIRYTTGQPSGAVKQAFDRACARVRQVIVGGLSSVQFPSPFDANACVPGLSLSGELVPGLRIYSTVEFIDGPGGVLGSAGPCYIRTSNNLPVIGRMRFDTADLTNLAEQGRLDAVIIHEMLHVIGIGTRWNATGNQIGSAPTSTPFFTGALARTACINDHAGATVCGGGVPIEDCLDLSQTCGAGTINSHWKESVFRTELMTGFLNAGENPFSRMTMQSLADIGYGVSLDSADPYTVPAAGFMSLTPAWSLRMPEPTMPIAAIDGQGRVTPLSKNRSDH